MRRYNSSYGGIETEIGEFLPSDLCDYFTKMTDSRGKEWARTLRQILGSWDRTPEKLMDIALDDSRELLVYGTSSNYISLRMINRNRAYA